MNCRRVYSNGQVSKTWRAAQLYTCCPSYRKAQHDRDRSQNYDSKKSFFDKIFSKF